MNQSLSEVMQNQSNSLITIDTQLKTTLNCVQAEADNPEVLISLIGPWPISLRYYLNLEYRSRQVMANHIASNDCNAPDWSGTK